MRYALAAILVALSLAASPVQAKGPQSPMDYVTSIPHDFVTGAQFYFQTVGGWFKTLLDLLGLTEKFHIVGEGGPCTQSTRCTLGLVCVNACDGADCDTYDKRCLKGPSSVNVLGVYSLCGTGDLCADGTACTRICPAGADCGTETHRCMQPNEPGGSCTADADCRAACGKKPFPPIGAAAWRASCVAGSCTCAPVKFDPNLERVECPAGTQGAMVCPEGTREACTPASCPSGICPPYLTCLQAPAYGGTCFTDQGCADAACAEGASPFCDPTEKRCRCRSTQVTTIACSTAADCAAATACAANEIQACIDGACACAPAVVVTTCSVASECSS
ncbi:MAG TPA: hypothetical protein VL283_04185, partial [Candidatus Baltobacteraceae bacterium]|nr:hypothetical protein [Candidatus Baltobacteraceae bacterium]